MEIDWKEIEAEIARRMKPGWGLEFRIYQGGIGWPRPKRAGFAVIIGEQAREYPRKPVYWILGFLEKDSPGEFIRAAAGVAEKMGVERWFVDTDDEYHMDLARGSHFLRIPVISPPYLDEPADIQAFIGTIKDLEMQGRLFVPSLLKARLEDIGGTIPIPESGSMHPKEIPFLMAVGGCLAGMERDMGYDPAQIERDIEMVDYMLDDEFDD